MSKKIFVKVVAEFEVDGKINPKTIIWEDGRKFDLDKITNICRAASLKVGGQGIRYTCRIRNKDIYLFLEENQWFVEANN